MKQVLTPLLCLVLTVGCFREGQQANLSISSAPSVTVYLVDEPAIAAALARVASHNDLTLEIPAPAQHEFCEALGTAGALTTDASGQVVSRDPVTPPFVVGTDGSHFWIVSAGDSRNGRLTLTTDNQGGALAIKTLTARSSASQFFFANRLLAEAESALGRKQFEQARSLAQNARVFGPPDKPDALLVTINQRQAESLLHAGEEARVRKNYRSARDCAQRAAALVLESERGPAAALSQRVLEDEGGELRILAGHRRPVTSVAISFDGKFAITGSEDKTVRVWDVATGKEVRSLTGHQAAVRGVAFSPDGRQAVSGGDDGFLKVWNVTTGESPLEIDEHGWRITSVDFSRDGRSLLCGSEDYHVKLWDAATGRRLQSFSGHGWRVTAVAFSPDAQRALSASDDDSIRFWNVASGDEVRALQNQLAAVKAIACSPDGRFLLSGGNDKLVKLWDLVGSRDPREFKGHLQAVTDVAVSPDSRYALSSSLDGTIRLWRVASGDEVCVFNGHGSAVNSVAFGPDGRTALSGGADASVTLWQLPREVWPPVLEAKR